MTDNLALWNELKRTDPAHTKKFQRSGGFRGTSVKPIYTTMKMTERFGPAGKGWGMFSPSFQVVPAGDEIAVYCTVALWWETPEQTVFGVGGDFVAKKNKNGLFADDEAFKKAFTDALGNAMKHLGMSADIHMGQHDDDKYVTELRREIEAENKPPAPSPKDYEFGLAEKLVKLTTTKDLDDLWRKEGLTIRAFTGDDYKRLVKMFSDRKSEINAMDEHTPLSVA